jgi:hypothetical protein
LIGSCLLATPLCRPGIIVLACVALSTSPVTKQLPAKPLDNEWSGFTNSGVKAEAVNPPSKKKVAYKEPEDQAWPWPKESAPLSDAGPRIVIVEKTEHTHVTPTIIEQHLHQHTHIHYDFAPALPAVGIAAPETIAVTKTLAAPQISLRALYISGVIVVGIALGLALAEYTDPYSKPPPKKKKPKRSRIAD